MANNRTGQREQPEGGRVPKTGPKYRGVEPPAELMVPASQLAPLVQAAVGQMKAEMQQEFSERLAKIDDLPTKWQLIATISTAIIVSLGLLFAMLSYFGDRQDAAVERSATISQTLTSIEGKLDERLAEPATERSSETRKK